MYENLTEIALNLLKENTYFSLSWIQSSQAQICESQYA